MKSSSEQIADVLAHAPPVPPLRRKTLGERAVVSDETRAKLILVHAAYATFGHPLAMADHVI
jgi:hypothetical protein